MRKLSQYSRSLFPFIILITGLLLLSACSFTGYSQQDDKYEFIAIGYATMEAQVGETRDIKMLNAIKASKLEAYKELAEQVYGVMLTVENGVDDYQFKGGSMKTKVKGLVRGAKVLRSYHEADLYITELGLNMKTLPFLKEAEFISNDDLIKVQSQVYY